MIILQNTVTQVHLRKSVMSLNTNRAQFKAGPLIWRTPAHLLACSTILRFPRLGRILASLLKQLTRKTCPTKQASSTLRNTYGFFCSGSQAWWVICDVSLSQKLGYFVLMRQWAALIGKKETPPPTLYPVLIIHPWYRQINIDPNNKHGVRTDTLTPLWWDSPANSCFNIFF